MEDLGSENVLALLEGTLKYEDARLPRVDMDDRSGPGMRMRSGMEISTRRE